MRTHGNQTLARGLMAGEGTKGRQAMQRILRLTLVLASLGMVLSPQRAPVYAAPVSNPICPVETVLYNPGNGQDIVVPRGTRCLCSPRI